MPNLSMQTFIPQVESYLEAARPLSVPQWSADNKSVIEPLGQGEYNMNFLIRQAETRWVLRVNTGSQIGLSARDQIAYEYQTLVLLEPLNIAPKPYFIDNSFRFLPYGIMGMAYLQGEKLEYTRDLEDAAALFASYHQLEVPENANHLIKEDQPLTLTYQRCLRMLKVYLESDLADPDLR